MKPTALQSSASLLSPSGRPHRGHVCISEPFVSWRGAGGGETDQHHLVPRPPTRIPRSHSELRTVCNRDLVIGGSRESRGKNLSNCTWLPILTKLTINVEAEGVLRPADAVADFTLNDAAGAGAVEAVQDESVAVARPAHRHPAHRPTVGHRGRIGARHAAECGRVLFPQLGRLHLQPNRRRELDTEPDRRGLRNTLRRVLGLAGEARVMMGFPHPQRQDRPRVLPLSVRQSLHDGLDLLLDWSVPVIQPRYLQMEDYFWQTKILDNRSVEKRVGGSEQAGAAFPFRDKPQFQHRPDLKA